eukprot:1156024-Pelagomonas_calceolata.AAC.3
MPFPKLLSQDGPGMTYARKVADLAATDPPTFICHYYNFYFAHTAGGRMIGSKMSQLLLDSATLKFYQWEGDVQEHLDKVRKVSVIEFGEGGGEGDASCSWACLGASEPTWAASGVL